MNSFSKRKNAFTIIELMVILLIVGVIATVGFVKMSESQKRRDFHLKFDKMVGQVREAQAVAKAFGRVPKFWNGWPSTTSSYTNNTKQNFTVFSINTYQAQQERVEDYSEVKLYFTLCNRTISMERMKDDFAGSALVFAHKSGETYALDNLWLFEPDGTLSLETGGADTFSGGYRLEMSMVNSSGTKIMTDRLTINKVTGALETEYNVTPTTP